LNKKINYTAKPFFEKNDRFLYPHTLNPIAIGGKKPNLK
jgi:hypothetical protein